MTKSKYKRRKYDLGVQQVQVPSKGGLDDIASPALSMAGTGAQLGSTFGPMGSAVGAGVGAVTGLVTGYDSYMEANRKNAQAIATNKYIKDNQRSVDPQLQKFQAKKGLDMSKYKMKYPGGTQSVINNSGTNTKTITSPTKDVQAMYSPSEREYLKQFGNNPKEKANAMRSLINYTPQNPNAIMHSQEWHKDNQAYNDAVTKFNTTYDYNKNRFAPSAMDSLNKSNLNTAIQGNPNSTNQKLDNFTLNAKNKEAVMMQQNNLQSDINKSSAMTVNTGTTPVAGQVLNKDFEAGKYNSQPQYAEGTSSIEAKPIEVEKDELIFKKIGGRYKLKADFQGGKSHEQGGEDYVAQEGDVIYPGKQRSKVLSAYKRGDYAALETMRMKLPKDKPNPINEDGNADIDPKLTAKLKPSYDDGQTMVNSDGSMKTSNTLDMSKVSSGVNTAIQAAPTIYNSIKGTFGKPVQTTRRYISPNLLSYQDQSDPNRRQSQEQFNIDKSNINNQVGTRGQQLGAMSQAGVGRYNRMSDINNYEINRKVGINNANTEIKNQAQQSNLNLANQYDQQDLQNKAAKTNYQSAATTGASNLSFNREQMNNQKERDQILANTLKTNNFVGGADGNRYYKSGKVKNGREIHYMEGDNTSEYYNDGSGFRKYKTGSSGISVGGIPAGVKVRKYKMKDC